jgi:transposase-like protein
MNYIQYKPGLTMPDFLKQFGTEVQCEAELERARWPQGFVCPCCSHTGYSVFTVGSHKTFQCQSCRHQTSLISGTLFQSTHLPLTVWFLAIYLISQANTGLSSLALMRHLGVSYPTAQLIQRKLKETMSEREPTVTSLPNLGPKIDSGQLMPLDK